MVASAKTSRPSVHGRANRGRVHLSRPACRLLAALRLRRPSKARAAATKKMSTPTSGTKSSGRWLIALFMRLTVAGPVPGSLRIRCQRAGEAFGRSQSPRFRSKPSGSIDRNPMLKQRRRARQSETATRETRGFFWFLALANERHASPSLTRFASLLPTVERGGRSQRPFKKRARELTSRRASAPSMTSRARNQIAPRKLSVPGCCK